MSETVEKKEEQSALLSKSIAAVNSSKRIFKTNVSFLAKFSDNHLIVGYFASIILPIVGFVASCILVRYKGDYTHCMVENFYVGQNPHIKTQLELVYTTARGKANDATKDEASSGRLLRYLSETDEAEAEKKEPEVSYRNVLNKVEFEKLTFWMSNQKEDRMKFWLRVQECLTFAFSISFFLFIQRDDRQVLAFNAIIYELLLFAFVVCAIIALIMKASSPCGDTAYGKMVLTLAIINLICGILLITLQFILY